jgi:hypothetical protein
MTCAPDSIKAATICGHEMHKLQYYCFVDGGILDCINHAHIMEIVLPGGLSHSLPRFQALLALSALGQKK